MGMGLGAALVLILIRMGMAPVRLTTLRGRVTTMVIPGYLGYRWAYLWYSLYCNLIVIILLLWRNIPCSTVGLSALRGRVYI